MAAERARLAAETVDGAPRPATDAELVAERRRQQELQAILEMSLRHRDRLVRSSPHSPPLRCVKCTFASVYRFFAPL
eukprot:scaffold251599_cov28-Tisochrysis_lutea.AAC.1